MHPRKMTNKKKIDNTIVANVLHVMVASKQCCHLENYMAVSNKKLNICLNYLSIHVYICVYIYIYIYIYSWVYSIPSTTKYKL